MHRNIKENKVSKKTSIIHIYHFDISSLAVSRTFVTHKNIVYDLARHEFSIAQWLERPTRILEGLGFDSRWGTQKIHFLSNFDLRTLLHLFHFIQVTISLIQVSSRSLFMLLIIRKVFFMQLDVPYYIWADLYSSAVICRSRGGLSANEKKGEIHRMILLFHGVRWLYSFQTWWPQSIWWVSWTVFWSFTTSCSTTSFLG